MVRPPPPLPASRPALAASAALAAAAAAGAAGAVACAPRHPRDPAAAAAVSGSAVTLYRDSAVVEQRLELNVPASGVAVARVRVPAGLGADDVLVIPQAGVEVIALRQPGAVKTAPPPAPPGPRHGDDLLGDELAPAEPEAEPPPPSDRPVELELTARARPGRVALRLGYVTSRLAWDAAYTLTASPAHDRAVLRGAVAIRNTGGVALPGAAVRLIDTSFADARTRGAAALTARLGLTAAAAAADAEPAAAETPTPRDLGRVDLPEGETRVELVRPAAPRPMRAVLVYDPVGTRFDHAGRDPATDADLGVRPPAGPRVDESFEIDRDPAITGGLPAGPVRLLERRPDGALALLGQSRLFDAAARVAQRDTITLGAAGGVTGGRERRELTVDEERKRVVEEFVITIDNQRPRPVEVVLREHLYRGTNWTLAYVSTPVGEETKEGPQQVAPRIAVPARGKARLAYTVVYWW